MKKTLYALIMAAIALVLVAGNGIAAPAEPPAEGQAITSQDSEKGESKDAMKSEKKERKKMKMASKKKKKRTDAEHQEGQSTEAPKSN